MPMPHLCLDRVLPIGKYSAFRAPECPPISPVTSRFSQRPDLAPYHKTFKNTRFFNAFGRNISKTHCFLMIYAFQVCQCFHSDQGHVFLLKNTRFFQIFLCQCPICAWIVFCLLENSLHFGPPSTPVAPRKPIF